MNSSVWAVKAAQAVREKVDLSFSAGVFFHFLWANLFLNFFKNVVAYRTCAIISRSWLQATLEYKPYIRTEFSEITSLKTKKWSLKTGKKIYKPRLIMARVRYTYLKYSYLKNFKGIWSVIVINIRKVRCKKYLVQESKVWAEFCKCRKH